MGLLAGSSVAAPDECLRPEDDLIFVCACMVCQHGSVESHPLNRPTSRGRAATAPLTIPLMKVLPIVFCVDICGIGWL